ncbi:MAG: transglutaminase family protein [Thermoplasmata archaeon]|nr:MAG: transglutaminase family protein [Thermoplasmata archaeon]
MRTLIGIITIILIIFSSLSGCTLFGSDDESEPGGEIDAFDQEDLSVPKVMDIGQFQQDVTKPTSDNSGEEVPFKYQTTWAFSYNTVYVDFGGVMQLWLSNLGENEMYIYEFGISSEWLADNLTAECGKQILPGEEVEIGYIAFPGPPSPGNYEYQLIFGVMARESELVAWYDWGIVGNRTYTLEITSLSSSSELQDYTTEHNSEGLYTKINDLIDPMQKDIRDKAVDIAKKYEGPYNIFQLCEIFQFVKTEISYVNDPRGDDNYWSTPEETLTLCAGDCEDQATLFAAMISAIDGTARIYITDSHAFASVYIGDSDTTRIDILKAINSYYNTELKFAWLEDDLGFWLVIDTINAMHPGGLPLGSEPLESDEQNDSDGNSQDNLTWPWDFNDTTTLIIIDVT